MDTLTGYVILILNIVIVVVISCIIFSKKYDKYKQGFLFSKFLFYYFLIFVICADLYGFLTYGANNFLSFFLGQIEGSGWDNVPPFMAHVVLLGFFVGYLFSIRYYNKMQVIHKEREELDKERKEYLDRNMKR